MIKFLFLPFFLFIEGGVTDKGALKPILYTKNFCSYCDKVYSKVPNLESRVEIRNIEDPKNLEELLRLGKKRQVPCLVTDGIALYESEAIISILNNSI